MKSYCFTLFRRLSLTLQWFWGSIQMDARAGESMYLYEKVSVNAGLLPSESLFYLLPFIFIIDIFTPHIVLFKFL